MIRWGFSSGEHRRTTVAMRVRSHGWPAPSPDSVFSCQRSTASFLQLLWRCHGTCVITINAFEHLLVNPYFVGLAAGLESELVSS